MLPEYLAMDWFMRAARLRAVKNLLRLVCDACGVSCDGLANMRGEIRVTIVLICDKIVTVSRAEQSMEKATESEKQGHENRRLQHFIA